MLLLFGGSVLFGLGEAGFEEFEHEEPHLFFVWFVCRKIWYVKL